jgi:hypothetical protein
VVPKIAKRGASFKGAAAYYLHDKGAASSSRVAFCHTENLPVAEPELAWRWMAYTARHAGILKQDAGVAATGRKLAKPVYTLSLSWSPEENPSREEMVAAAQSALKAIGLSKCQTLLVAHNDEPHPHIHALVNLVDPDSGKVRDPGLDKRKLSRWAEDFEKRHGKILCEQRVENNARRDRGELVKDRHSKTRQDVEQAKLIERQIKAEGQRRQVTDRAALNRLAQEKAQAIRTQINERFRPEWAALYQRHRQQTRDLARAERGAQSRMRQQRSQLRVSGNDWIAAYVRQMVAARARAEALRAAQDRELKKLRKRLAAERAAAVAAVLISSYRRDYGALEKALAETRKTAPALAALKGAARSKAASASQQPTTPKQSVPGVAERPAPSTRPGPRRGHDYKALKSAGPAEQATPTPEEKERRREQLKADFRRQAEEIARRRKERAHKDRDRDRER